MILRKGIRYDPMEFSNENLSNIKINDIYDWNKMFIDINKCFVSYDYIKYLIGQLSLLRVTNTTLYPLMISTKFKITNYSYNYENFDYLIEKNINNKENYIIENIKERLKITNFRKISNLQRHIFEDINIPKFTTIDCMEKWLEEIKNKWLDEKRCELSLV